MGCTASIALINKNSKALKNDGRVFYDRFHQPEVKLSRLSDGDKDIIKSQWGKLSCNLTENGISVFLNLFKQYPEIKELFRCEEVEDEYLEINSKFKGHAVRFMQKVDTAVENIDDLETYMSGPLLNLGKRHVEFTGFKPVYFEEFYKAISKVWMEVLEQGYTKESEDAWRHLFVFILETLKKGYHLACLETVTAGAIDRAEETEIKFLARKSDESN